MFHGGVRGGEDDRFETRWPGELVFPLPFQERRIERDGIDGKYWIDAG